MTTSNATTTTPPAAAQTPAAPPAAQGAAAPAPAQGSGIAPAQGSGAPAPATDNKTGLNAPSTTTGGAGEEGTLLGGAPAAPAEGKPNDGAGKQTGAPEKYEAFKLPQGVEASPAQLEKFQSVAKELNLSQEQAQKLVDFQAESAIAQGNAAQELWKQTTQAWRDETIKNLGANHQAELAFAAKAIDRFGSPKLREFFNQTGLGNHPEMTKLLVTIGKAVSEDTFAEGKGGPATKGKSAAQIIYPNHPSKTM